MTNEPEAAEWDAAQITENIPSYPSEKLADMIIANRYLGLFQTTCTLAMEELGKRRAAGDIFAYENYIETNLEKLPKLDFSVKSNSTTDILTNIKATLNDLKF